MTHNAFRLERCSGHCCRSFTLPFAPDELAEHAAKCKAFDEVTGGRQVEMTDEALAECAEHSDAQGAALQRLRERWGDRFFRGFRNLADIETIAGMVIYKGCHTREATERSTDPAMQKIYTTEMRHDYTCKNLQDDGNCGIYETRPGMCRKYPYGSACHYIGCTSSAAADKKPSKFVCGAAEDTPGLAVGG